jgi:hypothetical protein
MARMIHFASSPRRPRPADANRWRERLARRPKGGAKRGITRMERDGAGPERHDGILASARPIPRGASLSNDDRSSRIRQTGLTTALPFFADGFTRIRTSPVVHRGIEAARGGVARVSASDRAASGEVLLHVGRGASRRRVQTKASVSSRAGADRQSPLTLLAGGALSLRTLPEPPRHLRQRRTLRCLASRRLRLSWHLSHASGAKEG